MTVICNIIPILILSSKIENKTKRKIKWEIKQNKIESTVCNSDKYLQLYILNDHKKYIKHSWGNNKKENKKASTTI